MQVPLTVTVTVKFPPELTVIACAVLPVLHAYDEPGDADSVTELPGQKEVGPEGVMAAVALLLTVTATGAETAVQLCASVTVTLKIVVVVTFTLWVSAPLLQ